MDMTMSWGDQMQDLNFLCSLSDFNVRMIGLTIGSDRVYGADATISAIKKIKKTTENYDKLLLARNVDDLKKAIHSKSLALELNFQGVGPLGGKLENIQLFADLGVRHIGLCWNKANDAGGSATESTDLGLTEFGKNAIAEMERVGIVVDGAHAGYKTMMQAIDSSRRPFIISHTNCFSVTQARRNVRDDQIRACAATGGVIGMTGFGNDIGDPAAGMEALFTHLDHAVQLVGPKHVGLGLDYVTKPDVFWKMVEQTPSNWPDMHGNPTPHCLFFPHRRLEALTKRMVDAGYTQNHVQMILGGNWLRICSEGWCAPS